MWNLVSDHLPPVGFVVETKIDDENGVRNIQNLKRNGNLWWHPDESAHMDYVPTHWRYVPTGWRVAA